jgi:hypothetical protein
MTHKIKKRIFLVGCPRSGTTFLQGLIARHPDITTFPETHFYYYLKPSKPWLYKLGVASILARPRFETFLQEIHREDLIKFFPPYFFTIKHISDIFVKTLDYLTLEEEKTIWLDKTPSNLYFIDMIEKYVSEPHFIHIIRNGEDVVASLYEIFTKYPELWGKDLIQNPKYLKYLWNKFKYLWKKPDTGFDDKKILNKCINTWKKSIKTSKLYFGNKNHHFISYEQIKNNPEIHLRLIYDFIGVSYEEESSGKVPLHNIILDKEPWKKNYDPTGQKKFDTFFDKEKKDYITEKISQVEINWFSIN